MALGLTAGTASFQAAAAQITLREAIRQADRSAYGNRIAAAETAAQTAQSIAPLKGILPTVHFEAGYIRTTDPIGVFGSTLRQRSVSQANFDPQRLNFPGPLGNHQGAVVVEQPLINVDAWIGRRSADYAADAPIARRTPTSLRRRRSYVRESLRNPMLFSPQFAQARSTRSSWRRKGQRPPLSVVSQFCSDRTHRMRPSFSLRPLRSRQVIAFAP